MFDAVLFLAGAVLFFLAVLFFVFLWRDRLSLARRREELESEAASMKEHRVELDIWERELQVWAGSLEHEQLALVQAREELRMLTASKQGVPVAMESSAAAAANDGSESFDTSTASSHGAKNRKRDGPRLKL